MADYSNLEKHNKELVEKATRDAWRKREDKTVYDQAGEMAQDYVKKSEHKRVDIKEVVRYYRPSWMKDSDLE